MQIGGRTPGVNRGFVEFHRPARPGEEVAEVFRLKVQACPFGFPERIASEIPSPEPPVEYARDPKTGAALRGEDGLAVRTEKRGDRKWQAEMARVRVLRIVLRAREALRSDDSVKFEADEALWKREPRKYAEAIEREFREAGFSDAEVVAIFDKSLELERGTPQRMDEAASDFSPAQPEAAPAGDSPKPEPGPKST
jgi:hypothetical protein